MKYLKTLILSILLFTSLSAQDRAVVNTGADLLFSKYFNLIEGKRLGIVTNHSALLSNGTHLVDSLHHRTDVKITALFGPEHGIRGNAPDGKSLTHGIDTKTGLQVYSLYGKINKPTPDMLKDIDVLVFDIQDIGARFYTFISTLYYIIQTGAENNIPVIVLDRPNPITGLKVDGPVRKEGLKSFVGIAPIATMHGMTVGELAEMFAGENMIETKSKPQLTVIKMEGWKRPMYFDETNQKWLNPSPNITNLETAIIYPGVCLIEGTNVSEGRGTMEPFITIGAPFINSEELIGQLKKENISGVEFSPASFIPQDIPNMATNSKHQGKQCNGIKIKVNDRNSLAPVELGIKLVSSLKKLYPDDFKITEGRFDRLSGDPEIRKKIEAGTSSQEIISYWKNDLTGFLNIRNKYLLYQ